MRRNTVSSLVGYRTSIPSFKSGDPGSESPSRKKQATALWRWFSFAAALLGMASLPALQAAQVTINFDSDPTSFFEDFGTGNPIGGTAEWRSTDGNPSSGGYFKITDPNNSEFGAVIFKDFDNGQIITAFSFTADVRLGNTTNPNGRSADGMSISFARSNDPVLGTNATGGLNLAQGNFAAGLPEAGTATGLAISFDTWSGNTEADGVADTEGVIVRLDNRTLTNVAMATRNGLCADTNSPETGPFDSTNFAGSPDILCWQPLSVKMDSAGKLTVTYKGRTVMTNFQTGFFPSPGRLVFGGRTGGNNENAHVDNIIITTQPATNPVVAAVTGFASGFSVQILESGASTPNTNTIVMTLDGQTVQPTRIVRVVAAATSDYVVYDGFPTLMVAGSTHTNVITFNDNSGTPVTATRTFTIPAYTSLASAWSVASVDTSKPGFKAKVYQMSRFRSPGDANTIATAERAFALGFIDLATGQPYANTADLSQVNANGFIEVPGVVNWNITPASGGGTDIGNFRNTFVPAFPDTTAPGIPGAGGTDNNNFVTEIQTYVQLKAGSYRFGVNSDDGFRLSASRSSADVAGVTLGSFNGGRGSADTTFDFVAPADGAYPVRLLWWQGGGGGNAEFFLVDINTGQKVLINDATTTTAQAPILAYREATVTRPYVSRILPSANYPWVFADDTITVDITDGTIPVDGSSAVLTVNGTPAGAATKNGSVTTITRPGSIANRLLSGVNNLSLIYSFTEQGSQVFVTNNWTISTVPYGVIPAANKVAPGSVDVTSSGFIVRANQIDRSGDTNQNNGGRLFTGDQNRLPRPEMQLAGLNINPTNGQTYPNLATTSDPIDITDVLNFNSNPSGGNSGVFRGNQATAPENDFVDAEMPGLPGTGTSVTGGIMGIENYVGEFVTYLDLKAGAYVMAVNSDDGFIATSAPDPHDTLGTRLGFANIGRGNADPLPTPSTTAANTVPTPGTSGGNSAFGVVVPEDGIYPFRILYWQGGGGVNMEFSTIDRASGIQALVNDAGVTWAPKAYRTYTGAARPWVKFSISPEPWDNRYQQSGPGPIKVYGRTRNSTTSGDIYNDSDSRRPWADVGIGGVIANGVGAPNIGLLLDGNPVAATQTPNGTDLMVSYKPSPPLPSGTTHTASLIYGGVTNSWTFTVQTYTNLNAADAQPISAADTSAAGFKVKMTQVASIPAGYTQNTVARAEAQLAGLLGADLSLPGPGPGGTYIVPGFLNWNNNVNANHTGAAIGNFQANSYGSGWPFPDYPDVPIPGVPNTTTNAANAYTDNLAAEIFSYLKFDAAGYYKFGVNSDDGFKLQVGTPGQTNGTIVFSIDVGKGSSDIPFSFTVPQPGLYPMRLVYYNGGGGANLEYFSYDDSGNKIPINDTNNPSAIKAYYSVTTGGSLQFTNVTLTGTSLTIQWTGTGTLQEAAALTGSANDWSGTAGVTGNSYTVTIGATGNKFYRLKQ
jgi:hypothetical protein